MIHLSRYRLAWYGTSFGTKKNVSSNLTGWTILSLNRLKSRTSAFGAEDTKVKSGASDHFG